MPLSGFIRPLEELVRKLPFKVLDFEEVNRRFIEWKLSDGSELPEVLHIWVYVFAYKYLQERIPFVENLSPPDVSTLAADVILSVSSNVHSIANPEYFSNYCSRVCSNTLISHIRKQRIYYRTDMESLNVDATVEPIPQTDPLDKRIMQAYLEAALRRLSPVQEALIRRRFLDEIPYELLQEEMELSYGVIRNYVYRAMTILRRDPLLAAFIEEWWDE